MNDHFIFDDYIKILFKKHHFDHDNLIEKTSATNDPTTLTGQRDIEMAANNAVDQVENDSIAAVLNIKQVESDN